MANTSAQAAPVVYSLEEEEQPSVAAAAKMPSPSSSVIDLCSDDDTPVDAETNAIRKRYAKEATKGMGRKKRARVAVSATQAQDAIAVDDEGTGRRQKEAAAPDYHQVLGPSRMAFEQAWTTAHAFDKEPVKGKTNVNRLYKELVEYQLNLPVMPQASLFCRALEGRLDQVRVLVTGPLDTPYAGGCFFFDVLLRNYATQAPLVKFLTTGNGRVRFNPNLYPCGKVCLSLLGTWSGPGWQPKRSTLLQVLVSLQGLILVPDPYFNEPGFARTQGTERGTHQSIKYNRALVPHTLKFAILDVLRSAHTTYPEFATLIQQHFWFQRDMLQKQMKEWLKENLSLDPLIRQIEAELAALPTPGRRKAPPPPPETIVIDGKPAPKAMDLHSKQPPETIVIDGKSTPESHDEDDLLEVEVAAVGPPPPKIDGKPAPVAIALAGPKAPPETIELD